GGVHAASRHKSKTGSSSNAGAPSRARRCGSSPGVEGRCWASRSPYTRQRRPFRTRRTSPLLHQEMNMSEPQRYEALVLCSGAGGKLLAWDLAGSGRRTAVVERKYIGGSCPNINCLPSKNEVWSAKVADLIHHAAKFGMATGAAAIDMSRVRQRKR